MPGPYFKYVAHDSMCGCSRCAAEWECDNPQQVFDRVECRYEDSAQREDDEWEAEFGWE